jgi:inhibitor of cysteine peptidase
MNRFLSIVLAAAFFSIAAVSASSICDNAPCEKPINVSQGENFNISLESNPGSTGFEWWSQFETEYLSLVDSAFVPGDQGAGMVGAPGKQLFTFNAKKAGETDVIMLYLRPWENGTIDQRKIFPVNIS